MGSLPSSDLIRTDFWFNDGNIVLITQNAAFKVHKGQLARHSEVFGDLFSLPQPAGDLIDGCPFVVLQDAPSDVFYFLSALYDGLCIAFHHPPSFPSLAAVLRLSTKYLVDPLAQRCLFHLYLDWPTSLAGWDEREARFTLCPPSALSSSSSSSTRSFGRRNNPTGGRYIPREFCPHPILVIQFAREMNLPEMLPAAMYDLSRYGPSKITNGTTVSSTAFDRLVAQLTNSTSSREVSKPGPVRLSRELLCQTLRGREETQRFLASFIEKELYSHPPSPSCKNIPPALSTPPIPPQPNPQSTSASASPATPPPSSNPTQPLPPPSNPCTESFYHILLNTLRSIGGISFGRDADALFTLTQASEMLDRTDFYVAGSLPLGGGSSSGGPGPFDGNAAGSFAAVAAGSDPTPAAVAGQQQTFGLNICQACKQDFRDKVSKAREEMWSYLPRWFGLIQGSDGQEVS